MITAKELAAKLGMSQTAVSMALNNKPGVSKETRARVIAAAEQYGYDFSRLTSKQKETKTIYYISYRVHNAIMYYSAIESEMIAGIEEGCRAAGFRLKMMRLSRRDADLADRMAQLRTEPCAGIIVLATEMRREDAEFFRSFQFPTVLLDNSVAAKDCISVSLDNFQGGYMAAEYLLDRYAGRPGYIASSYSIGNFRSRRIGFENALKDHGQSGIGYIRHELTPTFEGAQAEMTEILSGDGGVARAYFAENDFLAIGALRAFQAKGLRVPEDVAVIGFDDIREDRICSPQMTSIHVPFHFIGRMAVKSFEQMVNDHFPYYYRVTVAPVITERGSA